MSAELVLLTHLLLIQPMGNNNPAISMPEDYSDDLVQDCSISSALALEILQSCTEASISKYCSSLSTYINSLSARPTFLWAASSHGKFFHHRGLHRLLPLLCYNHSLWLPDTRTSLGNQFSSTLA